MGYDDARAERDFRQNPPSNAPGQGGDDGWGDMFPEGSSSAEDLSNVYSSDINSTLSYDNGQGGYGQQPNPMMQQQGGAIEDKLFDAGVMGLKGIVQYVKEFVGSLKNNSKGDWHNLGVRVSLVSAGFFVLGILFTIIERFTLKGNQPLDLVIGSLLGECIGVFLCMFFDKGPSASRAREPEPVQEPAPILDDDGWNSDGDDIWDEFEDEDSISEGGDSEGEDGDDLWDSILSGEVNLFEDEVIDNGSSVDSDSFSLEDAMSNVPEIQQGTQTRQYLFETFLKVLPSVTPDYADMKEITTESDEFFVFEKYLRSAAEQVGTKEENIPELEELHENPFIYRLKCTRPAGMKEKQIADEIAQAYSWNNGDDPKKGVYARVETIPGTCVISIFKGFTVDPMTQKQVGGVSISLGDVYNQIKPFVCNPSVDFPFVWGINERGKTVYCDMKDNNTIIVSGMPRGGKSWKGQSIVAQLAMFHSPKEVQFYFLDNKNDASDYKYLSTVLPHARYFCGDFAKINDSLEKIIAMMENTNGKRLKEAGEINIKDYNSKHPQDKLPYVYVVIDELQALMNYYEEHNEKDEANRFRGYLSTMTSKLPYLGLRFIMFPHRIVNQIISKDAYTLVSSRVVVNQLDAKEVENAVGVSEAKFGYKLSQTGDMAIRLGEVNGGEACYCHAEILSSNNTGNKRLFDYIGAVWRKLEPDIECITINGKIGGVISQFGSSGAVENRRESIPARDNTNGVEEFEYRGYNEGSSISEISTEDLESISRSDDVDESFWEDFI